MHHNNLLLQLMLIEKTKLHNINIINYIHLNYNMNFQRSSIITTLSIHVFFHAEGENHHHYWSIE